MEYHKVDIAFNVNDIVYLVYIILHLATLGTLHMIFSVTDVAIIVTYQVIFHPNCNHP